MCIGARAECGEPRGKKKKRWKKKGGVQRDRKRKKERKEKKERKKEIVDKAASNENSSDFPSVFQPDEGRDLTTENEEMSSPPSLSLPSSCQPPRFSSDSWHLKAARTHTHIHIHRDRKNRIYPVTNTKWWRIVEDETREMEEEKKEMGEQGKKVDFQREIMS